MTSAALEETNAKTIEKKCRITLDFNVRITEITQERVCKSRSWHEEDRGHSLSQCARQKRLLHALLNNEEALTQFLIYVVTNDLERWFDVSLCRAFQVEDEEEILRSVYDVMDDEDASFFEEVRGEGLLFENTKLLNDSFELNMAGATLAKVTVMSEDGQGNRNDSDNSS